MNEEKNTSSPEKEKPGPKFIPIPWDLVDQYLEYGCTGAEIAPKLGIHHDTLYSATKRIKGMYWSEYSARMKQKGNISLRQKQYEIAMEGDRGMLIWLGKNRLDQKDHQGVSLEGGAFLTKVIHYADDGNLSPFDPDEEKDKDL